MATCREIQCIREGDVCMITLRFVIMDNEIKVDSQYDVRTAKELRLSQLIERKVSEAYCEVMKERDSRSISISAAVQNENDS